MLGMGGRRATEAVSGWLEVGHDAPLDCGSADRGLLMGEEPMANHKPIDRGYPLWMGNDPMGTVIQ